MTASKRETQLELALLAMFLDAEEMAVTNHETCTYPGSVFNDRIWKREDPAGFPIARNARRLLGLQPFDYRHATRYGGAGDRLTKVRAKDRAKLGVKK